MNDTAVPIVFLDTETDDLDPRSRQPWDVALIRREPDGTESTHQFFVELDLSTANSFALNVGKFWDRHPQGRYYSGQSPYEDQPLHRRDAPYGAVTGIYLTKQAAAQRIAHLTHGAHVVGAIPSFDTVTLEPLLWAHQLIPMWHYHVIDVEALAIGYLRGKAAQYAVMTDGHGLQSELTPERMAPPWKSEDLSTLLGVASPTADERHTALGDARWAMRIYDTVMGITRDENGRVAA